MSSSNGSSISPDNHLEGKVAIVTGGGSGFGEAIANRLVSSGAHVVISDINIPNGTRVASKNPSRISFHKADVTSASDWSSLVAHTISTYGRIDILVNNAGTSYRNKPTLEVTEREYDMCFGVNVKSVFLSVGAVVPKMIEGGGGVVVNISSVSADRPRPGLVWYAASKGAVSVATKALAAEYAPHIRFNSVCPLLSGTGLFEQFAGVPNTEENRKKFLANVPLGRLTEPLDVANAVAWLAGPESAFVTGVNLEVDGGRAI